MRVLWSLSGPERALVCAIIIVEKFENLRQLARSVNGSSAIECALIVVGTLRDAKSAAVRFEQDLVWLVFG